MAVQLLGLRPYVDRRGKERKAERFFENNWRSNSVKDLFLNLENYISKIPKQEHWNMYYTAAVCLEEKGRKFVQQDVLPIDVDGIDVESLGKYIETICTELDIKKEETGIVFSGNGLQFIIGLKTPITDVKFFDSERHLYKAMCGKINQSLYTRGLIGNADVSVFSGARLLRLPNTLNKKPDKPTRMAKLLYRNITPIDFNLSDKTGIPKVLEGEHIHPKAMTKLPDPDPKGVQEGCDFLKYCYTNQETLSEPFWYAMLSIIGRLPEGDRLVHEYSKGHESYDSEDTVFKHKQAIESSGPRKCDNIETLWDGCNSCPNYKKITSPIMLKSEGFISTKETGFYDVVTNPRTGAINRKPNYDDLVKHFDEVNPYATMEIASIVHTFDGKMWVDLSRNKLHNFAEISFDPSPSNSMCLEFDAKVKRTKIKPQDWFLCEGNINFENGVLDLSTGEILPHSPEYGFKYVLPFDFDPSALCPQFDKFLVDVTLGRQDLIDVLVEFMGYCLAGIDPQLGQKALILHGDGANGKSVLIEILRALAGKGNYSTLSMGSEVNKLENRYQLSGKLFNVSEETPSNAMVESSVFKALVSGGEVQARKLYCDAFSMRNYAKIIMACNELPRSNDLSHGMLRRLLIVPFDATFTQKNRDIHIVSKLKEELSGIFNLAMLGYHRFLDQDGFSGSTVIEKAVKEYVNDNDTVQNFLVDMCALLKESVTTTNKLYMSYSFYCDQGNLKALDKIRFGKRIKQILFSRYHKDMTDRKSVDGMRQRVYMGISLIQQGGDY